MPYHGLGSGIKRALEKWPDIDFTDDRERCLFTATVHRKEIAGTAQGIGLPETPGKSSPKSSPKTEDKIIELLRQDRFTSTEELGKSIGISKRGILKQINKLKAQNRLRRVGPAKGGYWEVIENKKG